PPAVGGRTGRLQPAGLRALSPARPEPLGPRPGRLRRGGRGGLGRQLPRRRKSARRVQLVHRGQHCPLGTHPQRPARAGADQGPRPGALGRKRQGSEGRMGRSARRLLLRLRLCPGGRRRPLRRLRTSRIRRTGDLRFLFGRRLIGKNRYATATNGKYLRKENVSQRSTWRHMVKPVLAKYGLIINLPLLWPAAGTVCTAKAI